MSEYYLIKKETLTDIANSIRNKYESSELINPEDMSTLIDDIVGGSSIGKMGKMVLEAYSQTDGQDATVPRTQYDSNEVLSDYFTYDEETYSWTCNKDFTANILLACSSYSPSGGYPSINLYINDELVITTNGRDRNGFVDKDLDTEILNWDFSVGDTVYLGKPTRSGYEAPYLAIFEGFERNEVELEYDEGSLQFTTEYPILSEIGNILVKLKENDDEN